MARQMLCAYTTEAKETERIAEGNSNHLLLSGNTGLETEVLLEGTVVVDVLEVAAVL